MKKINSIGYGGKIVTAAGIFLIAVPLGLLVLGGIIPSPVLKTCVYISLAVGTLISLFLIVLLTIELRQDRRMNAYYRKRRHAKIHLGNGKYECQSCGSRNVTAHDSTCKACGIRFLDANNVEISVKKKKPD